MADSFDAVSGTVTIVVDDYDPAIEFFVDVLGFGLQLNWRLTA